MDKMTYSEEKRYEYWASKLRKTLNDIQDDYRLNPINDKPEYKWINSILYEVVDSLTISCQELDFAAEERGYKI